MTVEEKAKKYAEDFCVNYLEKFITTKDVAMDDIIQAFISGCEYEKSKAELGRMEECCNCGKDTEFYDSLIKENEQLKSVIANYEIEKNINKEKVAKCGFDALARCMGV